MNNKLLNLLPKRFERAHKGSYGRLLLIAGSRDMTGCAVLAAQGALRSGVGILECACEDSVLSVLKNTVFESVYTMLPSPEEAFEACCDKLIPRLPSATALAVGPGLAGGDPLSLRGESVRDLIFLLANRATCPTVLDADGLTVFSRAPELLRSFKNGLVITPHPGEFALLSGHSVLEIQNDRQNLAAAFARKYQCTVLLKGHNTVVASPTGEIYINTTGNPFMARGGSGDVLTGIIGSFLAQGLPPFEAACLGAFVHGGSGDLAAQELGLSMLPSDLPRCIGRFLLTLQE